MGRRAGVLDCRQQDVRLAGLRGDSLAFKVDKDLFLGHCDRPGIHPAPYLARAQWIIMHPPYPLGAEELQGLLTRSHQLVVGKLPQKNPNRD
jgi:predicted DNA-binding protein (MmcQ/YjbR family)